MADIAGRMRTLRGKQSRERFAASFGKSAKTIERWEKGHTQPSEADLRLLVHELGVRYEWLKTGEGPMWAEPVPATGQTGADPSPIGQPFSELGDRIRQARGRLSRERLAARIGLSSRSIERWERGAAEPSLTQLIKLAEVLDVPPAWLLLGRDEGDQHERLESSLPIPKRETARADAGGDKPFIAVRPIVGGQVGPVWFTLPITAAQIVNTLEIFVAVNDAGTPTDTDSDDPKGEPKPIEEPS